MRAWVLLGIGAVAGAAVFAMAAGAVALRGGISARSEPSRLEARVASALRSRAIPSSVRDAKNPIPATPRVLEAGLAHFADHCATCHANDGSGDTPIGRGLYPRVPDMRRPETQRLTDGELFYIVENGVRFTGMPAWGGPGTPEGSWHLVHFIRHLPDLSADEIARMETLNPKSPDEWRQMQEEDAFLRGEQVAPSAPSHGAHSH